MATLVLNGKAVTEARICLPRVGVWTADVVVDSIDSFSGSVTMETSDGVSYVGTVAEQRAGVFVGGSYLRLVGGAAGMSTVINKGFFKNPTVRNVVSRILLDAQETLSADSANSVLDLSLPGWTLITNTAGNAIKGLLETVIPTAIWRITNEGEVFVGVDDFAEASEKEEITDSNPSDNMQVIASESPRIQPGQSFNGNHISYVEHVLQAEKMRSFLWYEIG